MTKQGRYGFKDGSLAADMYGGVGIQISNRRFRWRLLHNQVLVPPTLLTKMEEKDRRNLGAGRRVQFVGSRMPP